MWLFLQTSATVTTPRTRQQEDWFQGLHHKRARYKIAKPPSLHHKSLESNYTYVFWTGGTLVTGVVTKHQLVQPLSWLISNHKPHTENLLDYLTDNYLKACVRWLDKSDQMRPADRDTLLVLIKHTVDTITCYFTMIHLMKIQHAVGSSLCKSNQTTVFHSGQLFNSRMRLTCFALG